MIIWYCGATKQHQRLNWVPTATHQPRPMWRGSWWVTKRAPEANWRPWCSDGSLRMVVRREVEVPLKILKGRAETTAGGWTGSMDGWFGQVQLLVRTTWWRIWPETNWIGVMIASLSKRENQIQTLEAWKGCVIQSSSPGLESLGGRRETKLKLWIRARHRS